MQGNRAHSPAAVSMAQSVPVPGLWAAAGPLPSVLGSSAGPLPGAAGIPQMPGVPQPSILGSGQPQLPLWPNPPDQAYSLFPGSLNTSLALSMGMPGLGAPGLGLSGQGAFSYAGSYGQSGTANGGKSIANLSRAWACAMTKLVIVACQLFWELFISSHVSNTSHSHMSVNGSTSLEDDICCQIRLSPFTTPGVTAYGSNSA